MDGSRVDVETTEGPHVRKKLEKVLTTMVERREVETVENITESTDRVYNDRRVL